MPLLRWACTSTAPRRRAEDAVGAAAERPAHPQQGLLERRRPPGRGRRVAGRSSRSRCRWWLRPWAALPPRPRAATVAASPTPVTARPLACWNVFRALSVAAPKMPSAPPATVIPALINACCSCLTGWPVAPAGERAGGDRGRRRGGGRRSETEGRRRRLVDDAGDGQALVALERLHGGLGGRAEVAVDAVLDADADAHERLLERLHGLAVGALLEADDVRRRRERRRRRRSRDVGRGDRRGAQGQSGREQHHGAGSTDSGTTRACDRRCGHQGRPPCSCARGFGRLRRWAKVARRRWRGRRRHRPQVRASAAPRPRSVPPKLT